MFLNLCAVAQCGNPIFLSEMKIFITSKTRYFNKSTFRRPGNPVSSETRCLPVTKELLLIVIIEKKTKSNICLTPKPEKNLSIASISLMSVLHFGVILTTFFYLKSKYVLVKLSHLALENFI